MNVCSADPADDRTFVDAWLLDRLLEVVSTKLGALVVLLRESPLV